jgi:hypothetical protein
VITVPEETSFFVEDSLLLDLKRNITHEFRLPDAFRQILLKGIEEFDDVVLPYFRDEDNVAYLKDRKFKGRRNGHPVPVEFPTQRSLKNFQRATKEAAARVENTLNLTGIRVHHVVRAIFRCWLDRKFATTLVN